MALITEKDAAKYLKFSRVTMWRWRQRGGGPPWVKIGRSIRYLEDDLKIWIADQCGKVTH